MRSDRLWTGIGVLALWGMYVAFLVLTGGS